MFRQSNCPSFTTRGSEGCHHLEMFPVLGDDEKLRLFFPTLTCGVFVFSSVSAFLRLPPPPPVLLFTHPPHSLTHCQGVGCTPWPPSGVPWSPLLLRGRRGTMCTAKGSDVRPGVPWVSASFAWQAWDNVHCQGVGCTPWHPLGLRLFCVAGVGQCALPRGRMYALASLGSPPLLRGRRGTFNVHCQGVGCTPWRPLGLRFFCVAGVGQCALPRGRMYALASLGSPPFWRGRRGTMCMPSCRMYALASLGSPLLLRGRCGTMCMPRGRMYALESLGSPPLLRGRRGAMCIANTPWRPLGLLLFLSASFAWQGWDNVHCQGVGCTPWRPLGLRLFCVAGVGQCALPRGRMYALASLGSPLLLRGRRGAMCTAKGSDVRPGVPWVSASFAWQAWDNVHCQGVGCTPWRPLGLGLSCVAGVGQCALPRGRMYALASLGSPPLLCGRRGTMCIAKGSDVHSLTPSLTSPHLTPPHTYIQDIHTYTTTHTYTDTQTHIPLLQRFNYFGRSLGDWL